MKKEEERWFRLFIIGIIVFCCIGLLEFIMEIGLRYLVGVGKV